MSEEMFRKLVEESLAGAYIIVDGRLVYCNQALASIYGYSKEELGGFDVRDITPKEDHKMEGELNGRLLSGDVQNLRYETRRVRKDGAVIHVEMLRWKTEYEEKPAIIGTAIDITERKTIEREREDFLAMITHDFKAPLTSIRGFSELIMEKGRDELGDDLREMIAMIYRSGEKLSGMVEDFLVHSKLESGVAAPEKTPENMGEILKDVSEVFSSEAKKKGLAFVKKIEPGLPIMNFDKKLMERAVSNLIQNAVKYTPEGGKITVKAECISGFDGDMVVISVTDTGPGIPAELQPHLFEKYFRSSKTRGAIGTGLGLAVVKAVVNAHEGKVEVDSLEGEGCTFRIILPIGSQENNRAA
jgi:two-component system phosphate regulon sensor histidine kinase PhoR